MSIFSRKTRPRAEMTDDQRRDQFAALIQRQRLHVDELDLRRRAEGLDEADAAYLGAARQELARLEQDAEAYDAAVDARSQQAAARAKIGPALRAKFFEDVRALKAKGAEAPGAQAALGEN